jgi:hypothetical protein
VNETDGCLSQKRAASTKPTDNKAEEFCRNRCVPFMVNADGEPRFSERNAHIRELG